MTLTDRVCPAGDEGVSKSAGSVSVRAQGRIVFTKEPLKEQPCDKPDRGEVEADHIRQIPAGAFVVPRTKFPAVQPYAGEKFPGEDQAGVSQSPKQQGTVFYQTADRGEESRKPVDGKHPDGSCAGQRQVPSAESVKGCEGDFQKPPQQSAVNEVVQKFFHTDSIARFWHGYTRCGLTGSTREAAVQFYMSEGQNPGGKGEKP